MNKKLVQVIEGVISLAIVSSLYVVGMYVKPKEKIIHIERPVIELRDRFLGIAAAADKPGMAWMIGKEGKILVTQNAGKEWTEQISGTRENLQSIAAWDSQRAVTVGNTGLILFTADGGKTWKAANAPKSEVDNKLLRVRIDPQGTAWAVGVMGAVLASRDFGATWTRQVPEQDIAWNDVAFPSPGQVWLVGEFGSMMYTLNGDKLADVQVTVTKPEDMLATAGDSNPDEGKKLVVPQGWTGIKLPTNRSLMTIAFSDAQHGTVGGVEGTLLTTSDSGKTWELAALNTKEHILDLSFIDNRWIGVGGRGLLLIGDAGRSNWQVGRVKNDDYAWHAAFAQTQGELIMVGATLAEQEMKNLQAYNGK
jgi:photosystem II stability/assembly factor-like uncharacterized protein